MLYNTWPFQHNCCSNEMQGAHSEPGWIVFSLIKEQKDTFLYLRFSFGFVSSVNIIILMAIVYSSCNQSAFWMGEERRERRHELQKCHVSIFCCMGEKIHRSTDDLGFIFKWPLKCTRDGYSADFMGHCWKWALDFLKMLFQMNQSNRPTLAFI